MTERRFEHLLERCLQEVARTGDTQAVLRRYPQHADHLRPLLEVALATGHTYADVPEPPGRLAAGRMRLLEAAARQRERAPATQTSTRRKETRPKMKLLLATRLISAILAVVVGIAGIGGGIASAASDSLPGDALYPVKMAGEDLRQSLASTPEAQVRLALQFSDERLAEIEALAEHGLPVPETVVARMERHISRAMNRAAWASEADMPGLLEQIAQRTQAQAQRLEQLRASAQGQNQAQLQKARRICQQAQEEAMAGLGDPQAFRSRYQHREGMPEDVAPPEPPGREPPGGGPGPHGPGGPGQDQTGPPQDDRREDRDQERDREQDGEGDPQQDRDRDRQQDREGDQQQDRDRDRQQDCEGDQQQDRDRDRQQDGESDPQQGQKHDQQPDQQQDQQHSQSHDQGGSADTNTSSGPASSPRGSAGEGSGGG
jgi:hypothetical protein